jgi:RNA polymerase sigma-70 factor (sigma-E family)
MSAAGSGGVAVLTMSDPVSGVHFTWPLQDPGRTTPGTGPAGHGSAPAGPAREMAEADLAITAMYDTEYRSLVRMSAVLLGDVGSAEEIVQDSFIAVHSAWRGLRDIDKGTHYLRRTVMNRSRSLLRHRAVVEKYQPAGEPDMPSAEQAAIARLQRTAVIAALRSLPARQREAIVLRFYLDLSEADVAAAMRISEGAVKSHTARAKAALRSILEPER